MSGNWLFEYGAQHKQTPAHAFWIELTRWQYWRFSVRSVGKVGIHRILQHPIGSGTVIPKTGRIWKLLNLNVTCICIHVGPGSLIVSCRDHNVGLLARNSTNYLVSVSEPPFTKLLPGKIAIPLRETGVSWIRNTPQLVADLWDESIAQRFLNVTMHDALPMQIAKPRLASVGFISWLNAKSPVSEQNAC